MKILVTAYACEPGLGSEPGVGWNWVKEIARRHECHVVTRENNVAAILAGARAEGVRNLHVHGYDLPRWARAWKRGRRGSSLYYYLWQRGIARIARRLDREHDFDVVHHVTFVSSCFPSGLARVGKPFVWGPVGQHPRLPDRFLRRGDWRQRAGEFVKAGIKWALQHLDPEFGRTLRQADLILSVSKPVEDELEPRFGHKVVPFPAIGVCAVDVPAERWRGGERFRVLFSGRLVDLKGARLALEAFAGFARDVRGAELVFLGEGPLRDDLRERARELGLADRVEFPGHLPLEEALVRMNTADVFLFPSFEGAGMVVLEAMAAGTPVLCLDFGGPGRMVGSDRGVRIPLGDSFEETAAALASALALLHSDPETRERLARNALAWVRAEMDWSVKGDRLHEFYERAIAHRADRTPRREDALARRRRELAGERRSA